METRTPFIEELLSITEPRVCMDSHCTYPFGQACGECAIYHDAQKRIASYCISDVATYYEKEEEVSVKSRQRLSRTLRTPRSSSSTLRPTPIVDQSESTTPKKENKERAAPPLEEYIGGPDTPMYPKHTLPRSKVMISSSTEGFHLSPSQKHSASSRSPHSSTNTNVGIWLDEIKTLRQESLRQNGVFVGGAEDHLPVENPCPVCSKPQGDPIYQHYLRCKYAHEEQQRMDWMLSRGSGLERKD